MPRFFFHIRSPAGLERDDLGVDLRDIEVAHLEARRAMAGISADLVQEGRDPAEHYFEITDGRGRTVMEVPFVGRRRRSASRQLALPAPVLPFQEERDL